MNKQNRKVLPLLLTGLVSLVVLGVFLCVLQNGIAVADQRSSMAQKLSQIGAQTENAEASQSDIYLTYDEVYQSKADAAAYEAKKTEDFKPTAAWAKKMQELLNVTNVIVVDREGATTAKAQATPADFTRARFNTLREVFAGRTPAYFGINYPSGENLTYFSAVIDRDTMVVLEQDTAELDELQNQTTSWAATLGNFSVGLKGFAFAVSAQDYSFAYYPDEALDGTDAISAGIDVTDLEDGHYGWMTIDGAQYYTGVKLIGSTYIICAVPQSEITASRNITVGVVLFVFFAVITVVIAYAILLLHSEQLNPPTYKTIGHAKFDILVARKVGTIALIGLVLIGVMSLYMQTLFSLSRYSMSNAQHAAEVEDTVDRYAQESELITTQYNRRYLNKAQTAAYILGRHPELATAEELAKLSAVLDVQFISVFDRNGTITATDGTSMGFTLGTDPNEQSYAFRTLLNGGESVIQKAQPDDLSGQMRQYLGAALHDAAGNPNGFVQICIAPGKLENALAATSLSSVLSNVKVGAAGFAFAVDAESDTFTYAPNEKWIGRAAADYGMTEKNLIPGYSDYLTLNGSRYYASSLAVGTDLIYVVVPANEMNGATVPVTLLTVAVSLLCLLVIFLMVATFTKDKPARKTAKSEDRNNPMVDVKMPDGSVKKTESVAARWGNLTIHWSDKSPEQQMETLIRALFGVLAVVICLAVLFKNSFFGEGSIFLYILDGKWQRGVNIFAVTAALMELCVIGVAAMLLGQVLKALTKTLDARGETVCRLLRSFVKYISVIAALYYCLALFGVDTATLLASAGILSLVIGLGAQKLVSDVIAGLFLIFEGDFRVGDIVTVGGWRGTVQEIGVRTTKIEDGAHNVKILSNSEVTGIINMTRKYSYAMCDVGIEYGESLERVEAVLAKELPNVQKHLPAVKTGPFYKGVTSLGDNSVNIRIVAECAESDRFQLERDLNRELKLIFDRNNINIPFPQIVLNQPPEFKQVTNAEKRKADAFTKEQGELSKDIVDTPPQ